MSQTNERWKTDGDKRKRLLDTFDSLKSFLEGLFLWL